MGASREDKGNKGRMGTGKGNKRHSSVCQKKIALGLSGSVPKLYLTKIHKKKGRERDMEQENGTKRKDKSETETKNARKDVKSTEVV